MEDRETLGLKRYQVPYLADGESVVIPVRVPCTISGGRIHVSNRQLDGIRIRKVKVEGEQSKPAAQALMLFAEEQHDGHDLLLLDYAYDVIAEAIQ